MLAVDPGRLELPHVVYSPGDSLPTERTGTVVHVRSKIEKSHDVLRQAGPIRVCTVDMNIGRKDLFPIVAEIAPFLKIGGLLVSLVGGMGLLIICLTSGLPRLSTVFQILTIKLIDKPRYMIPVLREVQEALR